MPSWRAAPGGRRARSASDPFPLTHCFSQGRAMPGRFLQLFAFSILVAAVSAASASNAAGAEENAPALPPGHPPIPAGAKLPAGHPPIPQQERPAFMKPPAADGRSGMRSSLLPPGHPEISHSNISLFEMLASGIALHRGDAKFAYDALMDAARRERSPEIARMAWEAAIQLRDSARVSAAARFWASLDPKAEQAYQTLLAAAVDEGKPEGIAKALETMDKNLAEPGAKKSEAGAWLADVTKIFVRTQQGGTGLAAYAKAAKPYVEKYSANPAVLMAAAQLEQRTGSARAACGMAERALSKRPADQGLAGEAADVCWASDVNRTRALLLRFLERNPDNAYIRLVFGRVEQRLGRRDAALAALDRAMKRPGDDPRIFFNAGQLAADCGDAARAEKHFKAYVEMLREENPDIDLSRLEVWLQLGNAALAQQSPERAAEYYGELTAGPFAVQARLREALCLADSNRLDDALKALREGREALPLDAPVLYGAEANLLMEAGRGEEAHRVMTEAAEKFPSEPQVLYDAAMIAQETGHRGVAVERLKALLEVSPNHVQANNALGYLYVEANEHLDEAKKLLQRAYDAEPLDPYILDSMGWLAYREGRYKAAYEFTQASLKRLYDAEVAKHLIEILCADGRRGEAEGALADLVGREGASDDIAALAARLGLSMPAAPSAPAGQAAGAKRPAAGHALEAGEETGDLEDEPQGEGAPQ